MMFDIAIDDHLRTHQPAPQSSRPPRKRKVRKVGIHQGTVCYLHKGGEFGFLRPDGEAVHVWRVLQ